MMNILQDDNFKALIKKINDGEDFRLSISYNGEPRFELSFDPLFTEPSTSDRAFVSQDNLIYIDDGDIEEIAIGLDEDSLIEKEIKLASKNNPAHDGSQPFGWECFALASGDFSYLFSFLFLSKQ